MSCTRSGKNWPLKWRSRRRRSSLRCALALAAGVFVGIVIGPANSAAQIAELPRPDSVAGDFFGAAVAIDGDHVAVGATGIDVCGPNSGAAFIYERHGVDWVLTDTLWASDCEPGIFFGRSVDLSGRVAAVAASREFFSEEAPNAVYVFEHDSLSGRWVETARLTGGSASEEGAFATSVSVDEERILVTTAGDPAGAAFSGAAYLFERDRETGDWFESARLRGDEPADGGVFGANGALQGDLIAVAASTYFRERPGSIFIYQKTGDGWSKAAPIGPVEDFFISVDVDRGRVLAGESKAMRDESGSATIFEWDVGIGWHAAHVLRPDVPYDAGAFGSEIALEGDYALVVGFDEQLGFDFNIDRVVFVFRYDASLDEWRQVRVIDVGEVSFGADLDVDGTFAVIGSASEQRPGSVYVVQLPEEGQALSLGRLTE